MTDKVQKIKEWISKEQDGLMDANGNFEYPEHEGAYHILCNLDAYIDSLQEEPVSEDFKQFEETYLDKEKDEILCIYDRHAGLVDGANWQKEQMMAKAFDFTKEHNTACVLASECLRNHGWFNRERVFNDLFRHLSCVDKLFEGKFSGKTKVIVIKED